MQIVPQQSVVSYHTLPPGKLVGISDQTGPRLGFTVNPFYDSGYVDVVLFPTSSSAGTDDYAIIDGNTFSTGPVVVFNDFNVQLDPADPTTRYDKQTQLTEGYLYLIDDKLAICSYVPGSQKLHLLHWLDDGQRARPVLARTVAFGKWSLTAQTQMLTTILFAA